MGYVTLKGPDWKRISHTLETSFSDIDELQILVRRDFPALHRTVSWNKASAYVIDKLLEVANSHGELDTLLAAAASERPFRHDLRAITLYYGQQPGWAAPLQTHDLNFRTTLQNLTISDDPFIDTSRLAAWLTRVERQVCLVRCGDKAGTGFLVGADLVLTCYHVVENHLNGSVPLANVQVRFDYRRSATGETPGYDEGWLDIDPNWTIPFAPYSQTDITLAGDPTSDELDFALLRLAKPVGYKTPAGEDRPRGWIDFSKTSALPAPSSPCLIVQHPQNPTKTPPQMPLQIAFATPGFEGANANGTRLVYMPSTLPGSSGSPVFDPALRVFGLHHNRGQIDPKAKDLVKNNRGIPLGKIRATLTEAVRGMLVAPPAE